MLTPSERERETEGDIPEFSNDQNIRDILDLEHLKLFRISDFVLRI
jgi:hypothetical protein